MGAKFFKVLYLSGKIMPEWVLDNADYLDRENAEEKEKLIRQKLLNERWEEKNIKTEILIFDTDKDKIVMNPN